MGLIQTFFIIMGFLSMGFGIIVLVLTLRSLMDIGKARRHISDATGRWARTWHAGLIRYGQNVPNNGTLYRSMHNRRDEVTWEERQAWIDDNRELYYDILDQKNVCGKYAIGRNKEIEN